MNQVEGLRLCGARVCLREFRADDLAAAVTVVGDERVTRTLSFDARDRDQTAEMLDGVIQRAALRPRTEFFLATVRPADDGLIGFVRLALSGVRAAKLGFAVAAAHWRRGYATDAAEVILDFAFGELGLHRVTAAVGPENRASLGTVRRLGFRYEGRLRDHVHTNGAWRDSELYSLLAHERGDRA